MNNLSHKIREMIKEIDKIFEEYRILKIDYQTFDNKGEETFFREKEYYYLKLIKDQANDLFPLTLAFIESKNLPKYYNKFNNEVIRFFDGTSSLAETESDAEYCNEYSTFTLTLWRYLYAFDEFNTDFFYRYNNLFKILENILYSTDIIIKELNKKPSKESEVYKCVEFICNATFTDLIHPTQSFQKMAKCYRPDILIPSLKCAIEYKYADTKEKLIETIDQILIDVQGYSKNPSYIYFYAVFYVTKPIWTEKRFKEIWKEKRFPSNWKGIYIQASM